MSQKTRQVSKKSKANQIETMIRLLNSGKTQTEAAKSLGVNIRTVQRWVAEPDVRNQLAATQKEMKAIVESDPLVLSVTQIRAQVAEILDYRDSQRVFAEKMGRVVLRGLNVLDKAIERLENSPDELSTRHIPGLIKAITDANEKLAHSWERVAGLDDVLETLRDDPQVIAPGETEA